MTDVQLTEDDVTPRDEPLLALAAFQVLGRHVVVAVDVHHLSHGVLVYLGRTRQTVVVALRLWT